MSLIEKFIKANTEYVYDIPRIHEKQLCIDIVKHIVKKIEYEAETNSTRPNELYGLALEILDEFDIEMGEEPEIKYCDEHDAYYIPKEDRWTEPKCNDVTCEYCSTRPQKPSMVASLGEHFVK